MAGQHDGKEVRAELESHGGSKVTITATLRLWQERYGYLLDAAKRLRDDGHHEAAIVTAQTACEACMAMVLTPALRDRVGDEDVAGFITGSLPNYNPISGRVLKLYELLFGRSLQNNQPLWQHFEKHAKRRNDIVHHGYLATAQQADESIATVEKVIAHLLKNRP